VSRIIPNVGAIVLLSAWTAGVAGAAGCPPIAIVDGPTEIAAPIRTILRSHGLMTARLDCPDPEVHVTLLKEPGVGSYLLHIRDPFGRQSVRHVDDAETAASLIESWSVADTDDLAAPPPALYLRARDSGIRSAAASNPVHWRVVGALELAAGGDRSLWYGGALTACGPVAALCVGGRLRMARDDDLTGPDRDLARTTTEVLALAALPWRADRLVLTPVVGLGLGWIHLGAGRPDDDGSGGPASNDLGLRAEAAGSISVGVSPHLSLVGELGGSLGWSIATSARARGVIPATRVPSEFLRIAVACQYSP
jgi:hypothetical protein